MSTRLRTIHLLWPTIRPEKMTKTHTCWIENAVHPTNIKTKIAVNTKEHRQLLPNFKDVLIVGDERRGPAYPAFKLGRAVEGKNDDIIILASDDFFAPPKWDVWLCDQFKDFDGAIIVDDGYQYGGCITIPIMTLSTLIRINRIIYNPVYTWMYSDVELFNNLKELKCVKDLRRSDGLVFEHKHWANAKRKPDNHDQVGLKAGGKDAGLYHKRMNMSLGERLKA